MTRTVKVRRADGTVHELEDGGSIDLDTQVILDSRGRRFTEADAEAAVREIETRGPGRPSLSEDGGESKVIRGRVPNPLHARFSRRAKAEHKSQPELLREALEAFLD